jgi:hypothetical protein
VYLAEHRSCRRERRRRAIREIGGDGGAAARRARPILATVGSRKPFDLRLDRPARLGDEPLDRFGQLRRERND